YRRLEQISTDFERASGNIVLVGNPSIRGETVHGSRRGRINSDELERPTRRARIASALDIDFVTDPAVACDPNDGSRKRAIDQLRGRGRLRDRRVCEGKPPRGKRIPGVLDRR